MAISYARTWTDGDAGSAANLNSGVRDSANYAIDPHSCIVRRTSALTISNNTITAITYNVETADNKGSMFAPTSGTVSIVEAGHYLCELWAEWDANATGIRVLNILVNSVVQVSKSDNAVGSSATHRICCSGVLVGAAGDSVTTECYQNSGGNLNLALARLSVTRVSGP